MLQGIMRLVSTLISIYMLIIFIRIVMTWFSGAYYGRAMDWLRAITDPYLNIFRGSRWTQIGRLDLSAVVAIIVLGIVSNLASRIAFAGTITFGIVVAMALQALASAISFFMILFVILAGIRLVSTFFNVDMTSRFWYALDEILRPLTARFTDWIVRGRETTYKQELMLFGVILIAVLILGNMGVDLLAGGLRRLPF
ncbi:MAG: YggT family protein [bacterium]